jgi:hypothetical protein
MAEHLGRVATVYVSDDGGSTYNKVGELKDADMTSNQDLHDATSNDDGLYKVDLQGHKKATLSFTCNYDPSDTAQAEIEAAYYASTALLWKFRPLGDTPAAGNYERLFTGNLSSLNVTPATQGIIEMPVTVESSGTITYQLVS